MTKETKVILGIYLFVILMAVIAINFGCNPVKRVLLNDKYYQQVTDKFVSEGGCVNDTVFTSDTTVLFDTLYSLDFKTDTLVIDDIKTVVQVQYKTIEKRVTIRDTAVVTDQTQINLLKKQITEKDKAIAVKEAELKKAKEQVKEWKQEARKWNFRFWLLITIALVIIFRKPLSKLLIKIISPFKIRI